jgi:hypothetical protein
MSSDEIKGLVKMQMGDNASWNMVSNAAAGTGSNETTYSMGSRKLAVIIPDNSSIEKAKNKIKQVINGETLDSTPK